MEQKTNEAKLQSYIKTYEQIRRQVPDDYTATAILQEMAKDARMQQIRAERMEQAETIPATEKQIAYLQRLGVEVPNHLTKEEASQLIDDAVAKAAM